MGYCTEIYYLNYMCNYFIKRQYEYIITQSYVIHEQVL